MNPQVFDGQFKPNPYVPFNPFISPIYSAYTNTPTTGGLLPFEYVGWREEMESWHETCYIHAGLNPFIDTKISGPDALEFLSYNLTNGFKNFPVGKIKHAVMVNESGQLMADGILLRTGEQEFEATCLGGYIEYRAASQDYDVTVEDKYGDNFFYQLGGPRSLEIVEAACQEDLHDLGFLQHRTSTIAGHEVRIQRIGMAGSLAYEVHGVYGYQLDVYNALIEAGRPLGLVELGRHAYWNTHTENGFPQAIIHFPYATEKDEGYYQMLVEQNSPLVYMSACNSNLTGSLGNDPELRFVNPFELGWGGSVSFKHDFIGKEALERMKAEGHRVAVTLEWNTDDVLDVWRSGLEPGEAYAPMDGPEDFDPTGKYEYRADKVLADGRLIGTSTGRIHSWHYRKMISMGLVEPEYAEEGTELVVVWGNPNQRQKEIRATVARWPYMNDHRNENVDVMERVPRKFA